MMRILYPILTLLLAIFLAACSDDEERPVFGSGAWEFRSLGLFGGDPCTTPGPIVLSGEHGEDRNGKVFIARCRGTERSDGDLGLHLQLDDQDGSRIELRLILPSDELPEEGEASITPISCPSGFSFDARNQPYEAACLVDPDDLDGSGGECIINDVVVNRDTASISIRFHCDAVGDFGSTSVCNIGGTGSGDAVLSFDSCEGL